MKNLYPVIPTDQPQAMSAFYAQLLDLKPVFEADWFVQLQGPSDPQVEIAFVQYDHPSVPEGYQQLPRGVLVTFESDEVDALYQRARQLDLPIALELRDEDWGQRHFMARDPAGLLVDIVKVTEPSAEFAEGYID